jgi:hypothetical protein
MQDTVGMGRLMPFQDPSDVFIYVLRGFNLLLRSLVN